MGKRQREKEVERDRQSDGDIYKEREGRKETD